MKPQHSSRRDAAPSPPGSYGVAPPHFPPNGFKFPLHGLRHPALYPRGLFPPGMFHPDSRFSIPPLLALSTVHHGGRLPGRLGGYMHPFQHTPRGYHPQDQKSPNRSLDHGLSYSSGSGNRIPGSGLPLPSHAEKRKYKNRPPNRSPVCGQSRNRSPVGRQSKNRSPVSGQVRSRSPFYGQSRNRSPVCGQSRSRSPVCGELRSRSPVSTFSSAQPARSVSEIQVAPQVNSCNMRGTDENTDELRRHINNSREEMRRRAGSSSEEVWDGRNCAAREEVGRRKNNSVDEAWDRRNSSSSREEVRRHMSDGTGEVWDRRHSSSREEVRRRSSDGSEEVWDRRSSTSREEPARQTNDSAEEVWDRRNSTSREEVRSHTSDSTEDERWDRRNSSGSREDARRHRGSCNEDIWDQRCCGREPVKVVADNHTEEMVRHVDICSEEERRCTNSHTEKVWNQRNHNTEEVRMRTDCRTDEVRMYIESQTEEVRRYADSQTEEARNQANVSTEEEINVTNIESNEAAEHCGNYNRMSSSGRSSPSDDIQNVTRSSVMMSGNNNTAANVGSSSSISGESLSTASSQEVFRTQRIDSADHLESQTEPLSLVKSASSSSVDDLIPSTSTPESNLAPNRPFRNVIKISGLGSIGSKIPGAGFSQILPLKKRICTAFAMEQDTTILPFRSPLGLNKPLCVMTESVAASEDSGSVIDLSTNLSRYVLETPLQDLSKKHNCKSASKGSSVRVTSKKRKSRNRRDHSVPGITKCPVDKSKPGKARRKPLSQKSVGNSQRRTRSQTRQHTAVDDQQTVVPDVSECSSSIKTAEVSLTKQSDSDGGMAKEKTNSPANSKVTQKGAKDNEKDVSADEKCSPSKSSSAKASAKKAITTCNKITKSLDRKVKPLTKGSKRASTSKCDSATPNEQMSSPKKGVNKSNLCKKLKRSSKLQGKCMSHCRNSKNSDEYKSLRRNRQPKTINKNKIRFAACNNDNRSQGLDGNHGSVYIVKNTSVHMNHISCSDVAKSLVHDVSDALKIPDQPRSESTSLEECLDVASDQVASDDKMKGMNVVGTLSPIIKSLLGQPARGIRDLGDPVLMPQLSLKIPDVFMSKVTDMSDRSGMPMLPYAIKEDVEDREDANSRDSKLVSPKSICLKVGENDLETLSIKDLSVKICRLSPKALSEKKTARASVVEKQACPISSQVSLHKGNDVVKKEDQQQGSGLLEDLLWQVQKGYFLRRGEEKSGVSIDEAASVAQAVSYDASSVDGERSLADPPRDMVVHRSESQSQDQDKSKEHSHSGRDPVEKVGNSQVVDDRQRINTVYEVMANKQNYDDSDEDNLDLSDRPLIIDLPPESELNDKTSLLEDSKHPSAHSTGLIKPETKSINKASKCSQKKPRKAHRKSSRKAKQKLDPSEDRTTGVIPEFQSSDLSHELEKDVVDNGKDSGIESAGVPEQLKECPCDLSEAGERLKENNTDSNNDSQKAITVHCALVKSAGSTPKTTSKTKPRFRGIDDICASLVNKKVAKKQMPVTQSSPPPSGHETRGKNREKITKSASSKVSNSRQHSSPKVTDNDSSEACDSVDVCDQVQVKTEFGEKPVPCSPDEEQKNNSAEETVEVLEKSVTSAESEAESLINNANTQPEVESSETGVICAESEVEKRRDSSKSDGEMLTKCSNSIKVSEECTTTLEPLAISTGSLESGTLRKDTCTVHSVKPSDDGIIKDSQPSLSKSDETMPTKKGLAPTESFRHGSRAAKRKALEHIHKDVKGEDKTVDRRTGNALPQPPKKKRGRPSKSPTKICKQKHPTTARSCELTERNTVIEIASTQQELPLPKHDSSQTSRSVVRHKKLKKKKKTKYVNEENLSDGIKATASSLSASVNDENISVGVTAVSSSLGKSVVDENVSDHVKTPSSSLNEYLNEEKVSDCIKTPSSSLNEYVNDENASDHIKTASSYLNEYVNGENASDHIKTPSSSLNEYVNDKIVSDRMKTSSSSSLNEYVNDENASDHIKTSSSSLNEYVDDENASDGIKKPTSPLNENVSSIVSTEKSDEPKDRHIEDKRCCEDPGHVTECTTKKFFTSHAGRSKFSPPYMLLSALINPSSKKNLSPPYSVKKKPQLTAKSSLDIYDFDEDDEETVDKTNVKSCKHPANDKTVPSSKGKRGRKPKSHIKLNQPATEFPIEPVRDYVQITESYQPQCRFLRPRNRINYNENELDKPPPTETEEVGTNHHLPKTSFSVKKSSLSLKIKVPQPVAAVNNSVSSDSEGHEEASDSLFRSAPECESKSPPKPHRKRHRDSSSGSHKMTVTSETISVTTNEVTHYGSDSDDSHQCSGPIIRAPNISEMNAHHRGKSALCEGCKDGECSMVVTTHRVRFRLVKIGQGLWKTIDAVQDPLVDGATADNRVHLSTQPERSPCLSDGNEDSSG
ncbi:hypothetical protein LSH36_193g07035 [Paralvinella palmiformis]|uniref:Uncharacterized protein n=1 Tax=Paralvinella palmiformis TaxID=53620 RepID=A0AAD9JQ60_9ANNE|nr:hypothetical protein LSH36_193g07035 [Paralvinella palmiformis]